ncbi:SulP family inorganic anion transporter, partial [Photobacterium sp. BZF1]|uniref:STAS domain-containing protein n=1 Tax=Photobacterium sp. BZF1 TaxID=1904457 RepID=UPI001653A862
DYLKQIPMAALVAVMIMVAISTFSWQSLIDIKHHPLNANAVMLATVVTVVLTHNLAIGVAVGVLVSTVFYANHSRKIMKVTDDVLVCNEHTIHKVHGQIFFASAYNFMDMFNFRQATRYVTIDLSDAHFWDITAVGALDKVVLKFMEAGSQVEVVGMNQDSEKMISKFAIFDKPEKLANQVIGH